MWGTNWFDNVRSILQFEIIFFNRFWCRAKTCIFVVNLNNQIELPFRINQGSLVAYDEI